MVERYQQPRPVPKAHPFVRTLFAAMVRERIPIYEVADRAGLHSNTLIKWRTCRTPRLEEIRACLNVVGLDLAIVRADLPEDGQPPAPRPYGLTAQELLVWEALQTAAWVGDNRLGAAAAPPEKDPIQPAHLKTIISKIRKKTGATIKRSGPGYAIRSPA